jgi:hypothetical protein
MAPDVEAGRSPDVAVRNHHAVGLHRAVDLRAVAAHDEAFLLGPRRLAGFELLCTLQAFCDEFVRAFQLGELVDFVVTQRPIDCLVINFEIGQQIGQQRVLGLGFRGFVNRGTQFGQPISQSCPVRIRNRHTRRWHWAHVVGLIVFGAIRKGRRESEERKEETLHGWIGEE